MSRHPPATLTRIAGDCCAADQSQLAPLINTIVAHHNQAPGRSPIIGIIYYGSCFRHADPTSGLVDFYVVVDTFRGAGIGPIAAFAGTILPPNVYYLAVDTPTEKLACKYALITRSQLDRGVTSWFSSTLWGRFAQPLAIVYARDTDARELLRAACGQSVVTLLERALPAMGPGQDTPANWFERALALSFSSEIRVETGQRTQEFMSSRTDEYTRRFANARELVSHTLSEDPNGMVVVDSGRTRTELSRLAWRVRAFQGRVLSALRLVKACFTFDGAIDYGAWKLARHTGYEVHITKRVRQHPLIFGWPVFWRALRAVRQQRRRRDRGD